MTDPIPTPYLETLVGEGKKYKDIEELAKAYTHASAHITELRQEKEATVTELTNTKSLLELLTQAKNEPQPTPVTPPNPEPTPAPQAPVEPQRGQEPADVESVVARLLEQREAERRVQDVMGSVVKQFNGDNTKAHEFLVQKAQEFGVTPEWFAAQSATNPSLVTRLLGLTAAPRAEFAPKPDVNPQALGLQQPAADRDNAYYQELRRTNRALYMSSQTQMQMEADLVRLGPERFYNRKK